MKKKIKIGDLTLNQAHCMCKAMFWDEENKRWLCPDGLSVPCSSCVFHNVSIDNVEHTGCALDLINEEWKYDLLNAEVELDEEVLRRSLEYRL